MNFSLCLKEFTLGCIDRNVNFQYCKGKVDSPSTSLEKTESYFLRTERKTFNPNDQNQNYWNQSLNQSQHFEQMINVYDSLMQPSQYSGSKVDKENKSPNVSIPNQNNMSPKKRTNLRGMLYQQYKQMYSCVLGTRFYRAPEVLLLNGHDSRSEIWSLGCIFLEVLLYCPSNVQTQQFHNSIVQENLGLKKFVDRKPIFFGTSCELFSPNHKENLQRKKLFKNFFYKFEQLGSQIDQISNEDPLYRGKHLKICKTEPRNSKYYSLSN